MKQAHKLILMLSLVAMAPSYAKHEAKKSLAAKKVSSHIDETQFKGVEHRIVFINNQNTQPGDGTFRNPYNSIATAAANSKEGAILYVVATGTPYAGDIELKAKQILVSSFCGIKVAGTPIPAATRGDRAEIAVSDGGTGVTITDCNQVIGFLFIGTEEYLVGTGTGISSDSSSLGLEGSSVILRNSFENLVYGVNATLQCRSDVEICDNSFSDVASSGIALVLPEQAVAKIRNNSIKGTNTDFGVLLQTPTMVKSGRDRDRYLEQIKTLPKDPKEREVALKALKKAIEPSSGGGSCFMEGNTIDVRSSGVEIPGGAFAEIDLCKNTISSQGNGAFIFQINSVPGILRMEENTIEGFAAGAQVFLQNVKFTVERNTFSAEGIAFELTGISAADGRSGVTACVKHNTIQGLTVPVGNGVYIIFIDRLDFCDNTIQNSDTGLIIVQSEPTEAIAVVENNRVEATVPNLLALVNAKATVKGNSFKKGTTGLIVALSGNVTACVECNEFCEQTEIGCQILTTEPAAVGNNCLTLKENKAKSVATGYIGYQLQNQTATPELFQVGAKNLHVLEAANKGSVEIVNASEYVDDDAVVFVGKCKECCK